jgi:hypothetical protein
MKRLTSNRLMFAVVALPAHAQAPTQEEIIQELIGTPCTAPTAVRLGLSIW